MSQRAKRRDVLKEAQWRELVAAHQASHLSVRALCAQQSVPENSFYAWWWELPLRDAEIVAAPTKKRHAASRSQQGDISASRAPKPCPTFVPVTFASPPSLPLVEVALAQSAVLHVHVGCDAATFAMVLAAVGTADRASRLIDGLVRQSALCRYPSVTSRCCQCAWRHDKSVGAPSFGRG